MYPLPLVLSPGIPEKSLSPPFLHIPFRYLLICIDAIPLSLLFLVLNPSSQPLLHMTKASVPSSSLWTCSGISAGRPFFYSVWEPRIGPGIQMCPSSAEERGRITSPDLLVILLLMQDKGGNAKGLIFTHREKLMCTSLFKSLSDSSCTFQYMFHQNILQKIAVKSPNYTKLGHLLCSNDNSHSAKL